MKCSLVICLACLLGCATSSTNTRVESSEEPGLIAQTATYELHVRNGKLEQVIPNPDGTSHVRVIDNEGEARQLYVDATGQPLPANRTGMPIEVNGWVGLECVRNAKACGAQPADAPRTMVVLKFQ